MTTITFRVSPAPEGGYVAQAIGHAIFTQGETQWGIKESASQAAALHFGKPVMVRFHPLFDDDLIDDLHAFFWCVPTKIPGESPPSRSSPFENFDRELKYGGDFGWSDDGDGVLY